MPQATIRHFDLKISTYPNPRRPPQTIEHETGNATPPTSYISTRNEAPTTPPICDMTTLPKSTANRIAFADQTNIQAKSLEPHLEPHPEPSIHPVDLDAGERAGSREGIP